MKRAYEIGKEYYNPHKIKIKRNVDLLIHLYDTQPKSFEKYIEDKTLPYFRHHLQEISCTKFFSDLEQLKKYLVEVDEAFRVKSPFREDIKNAFFKFSHQIIYKGIGKAWEYLFSYISFRQVIMLSNWVYEYWLIINSIVPDTRLIEGVSELTRIYLKKMSEKIKSKI